MLDKRDIRLDVVSCLCGEEVLSSRFLKLLEDGHMTEKDGLIIRNNLLDKIDSYSNLDMDFYDEYLHQFHQCHSTFKGDSMQPHPKQGHDFEFPHDELSEYLKDEEYLQLLDKHFPKI